ncbi:uncharacterized protein LOC135928447 isoform X2 [Gordionus sp. m RMFG-2023]
MKKNKKGPKNKILTEDEEYNDTGGLRNKNLNLDKPSTSERYRISSRRTRRNSNVDQGPELLPDYNINSVPQTSMSSTYRPLNPNIHMPSAHAHSITSLTSTILDPNALPSIDSRRITLNPMEDRVINPLNLAKMGNISSSLFADQIDNKVNKASFHYHISLPCTFSQSGGNVGGSIDSFVEKLVQSQHLMTNAKSEASRLSPLMMENGNGIGIGSNNGSPNGPHSNGGGNKRKASKPMKRILLNSDSAEPDHAISPLSDASTSLTLSYNSTNSSISNSSLTISLSSPVSPSCDLLVKRSENCSAKVSSHSSSSKKLNIDGFIPDDIITTLPHSTTATKTSAVIKYISSAGLVTSLSESNAVILRNPNLSVCPDKIDVKVLPMKSSVIKSNYSFSSQHSLDSPPVTITVDNLIKSKDISESQLDDCEILSISSSKSGNKLIIEEEDEKEETTVLRIVELNDNQAPTVKPLIISQKDLRIISSPKTVKPNKFFVSRSQNHDRDDKTPSHPRVIVKGVRKKNSSSKKEKKIHHHHTKSKNPKQPQIAHSDIIVHTCDLLKQDKIGHSEKLLTATTSSIITTTPMKPLSPVSNFQSMPSPLVSQPRNTFPIMYHPKCMPFHTFYDTHKRIIDKLMITDVMGTDYPVTILECTSDNPKDFFVQ